MPNNNNTDNNTSGNNNSTKNRHYQSKYKLVSNWLVDLIQKLHKMFKNDDNDSPIEGKVMMAMAVETLAKFSSSIIRMLDDTSCVVSILKKVRPIIAKHLLQSSKSIWGIKSASAFIDVLNSFNLYLSEDIDTIFDVLIPNLCTNNHFVRLHTIKILASYPKRPYVIDHADLDLHDDLDEEEVTTGPKSTHQPTSQGPTGPCSILDTLLEIESTPIDIKTERYILSQLSRVGVLGRTGRLPIIYAEAAVSHLLGLFYVKYAPLWQGAVQAVVELTKGHEDSVWPILHEQLAAVVQKYPYKISHDDDDDKQLSDEHVRSRPMDLKQLFVLCLQWESSCGNDHSLFNAEVAEAEESGHVSNHLFADEESVFQSLWTIPKRAPKLITAHSKTIVPIFLEFMHTQYYRSHPNDPDARELDLQSFVSKNDSEKDLDQQHQLLDLRIVHQRLRNMLEAYSSVNGPEQLFRNQLLMSIFTCLAGNQDTDIARIAFSCLMKFKLPYLAQYSDALRIIYEKGKFRDAMMQMKSISESTSLIQDHRKAFIPIFSRILFGRLSARAIGSKSSKDSPSARRTAALSFLSSFCDNQNELFPFIFLAVRPYVPRGFTLISVEKQDDAYQSSVLDAILKISADECRHLPMQIHQGFLNILEAILSQLGCKSENFVHVFTSIVLVICDIYQIKASDYDSPAVKNVIDDDLADDTQQDEEIASNDRSGVVRSLCYRRLSEIFGQFAPIVDLRQYSKPLWSTLHRGLELLPSMASNADKAPSLLILLKTISGEDSLIEMLRDKEEVIPSVLRCLSDTSKTSVVDNVLSFIDNLLGKSGTLNCGRELLQPHLNLLLERFSLRLTNIFETNTRGHQLVSTWRRELSILCSVSEMVENKLLKINGTDTYGEVIERLISLLIPFLDHQRGIPEPDKMKVLEILIRIMPGLPDAVSARHVYFSLVPLLGPYKAKKGITSIHLRSLLVSTLQTFSQNFDASAKPVTDFVAHLCAVSSKKVDEMDYDRVIKALSELGNDSGKEKWMSFIHGHGQSDNNPFSVVPVVHSCFNLLFEEDGVVSRAAFSALKTFVHLCSKNAHDDDGKDNENKSQDWKKLLEAPVVSTIRIGLTARDETTRRFFILLLREVAFCNKDSSSPNLYGDLHSLVREDQLDLDFFLNITHVQIHRRARGLNRLRKLLQSGTDLSSLDSPLTLHSLSNVLLPLATHPIYESKRTIEESFALEGIATVGAIARHLSWSKYNTLLGTHLNQFERHPQQEKYLVALICSIVDAFHFDVSNATNREEPDKSSPVLRALENRLVPKIESLLIKEKSERTGKIIRPTIVLALVKLFRKLPDKMFRMKLPRLLTVLCDALRSRESNARDLARTTLAKLVLEIDLAYLADVIRELATILTEGYKLHVRTATLHTILLELLNRHNLLEKDSVNTQTAFDATVPAFMELLQDDLFGTAQERREAQSQVRYVKEASGSKGIHSLELIASMIFFDPCARMSAFTSVSSIQALVLPLLERLRSPGVSTSVIRRIKDCLSRIVTGLLRNRSLRPDKVLLFVSATIQPFVSDNEVNDAMDKMDDGLNSDDDAEKLKPIKISGANDTKVHQDSSTQKGTVVEWRPSMLNVPRSAEEARSMMKRQQVETRRVKDGASAPKLTGSNRNSGEAFFQNTVNDPSTISAVIFGLQLLSPTLKRMKEGDVNNDDLDSFVPLLTTCVCNCRDTEVILLSLKCLVFLLKRNLPSLSNCSKSLANKTLDLMISAGANQELLQATFRTLTLLMNTDKEESETSGNALSVQNGENAFTGVKTIPLDSEQMLVMISFLQESIVQSEHHNHTVDLIKAIMSRRYISAEFYDLMETMLAQTVRSTKPSLREQSGTIFVNYLLNYPLSPKRVEQHLQKVVLNLDFELKDGRLSAISLATRILDRLPIELVEKHCQLFFLPLTLRLVNDESTDCREAIAKCLGKLLKRISTDVLNSLYRYTERWLNGDSGLRRMAIQLFGIFVEARPEFIKQKDASKSIFEIIAKLDCNNSESWEESYLALVLLEKMTNEFQHYLVSSTDLWNFITKSMAHPHLWVRLASSRLISSQLQSLGPMNLTYKNNAKSFLVKTPGALFQVARNFCFQLGADEEQQNDDLVALAIKSLTWILQAGNKYPDLCSDDQTSEENHNDIVLWVVKRLSHIAKPKGTKRRQAVFKCFAAFASSCDAFVFDHLELMLEPLHRTESETKNELELPTLLAKSRPTNDVVTEESQLAKDVLHLLEEKCDRQERFLQAYAAVKLRARDKKEKRKQEAKSEYVLDPEQAAKRRIEKQEKEKKRRKRRVEERRTGRGAKAKKRHI